MKANAALAANHILDNMDTILEEAAAFDKTKDEEFVESERGDRPPKELSAS